MLAYIFFQLPYLGVNLRRMFMNTKQRDAILFWALAKNFQIVEMSQQFNEKEAYAV